MANGITGLRIICSAALLFFPALSPAFFALYLAAGVTDMADGIVARRTNTVSDFGRRWDTFADFIFMAACLIKLLPVLMLPAWMLVWIALIAAVKLCGVIMGFALHKRFLSEHTLLNKAAGVLLFLLPFTLPYLPIRYSAATVCAVATVAALHEGMLIRAGKAVD